MIVKKILIIAYFVQTVNISFNIVIFLLIGAQSSIQVCDVFWVFLNTDFNKNVFDVTSAIK